jgi:hypothetical protein
MKVSKKRKAVNEKLEKDKVYSLEQATALIKTLNTTSLIHQ